MFANFLLLGKVQEGLARWSWCKRSADEHAMTATKISFSLKGGVELTMPPTRIVSASLTVKNVSNSIRMMGLPFSAFFPDQPAAKRTAAAARLGDSISSDSLLAVGTDGSEFVPVPYCGGKPADQTSNHKFH